MSFDLLDGYLLEGVPPKAQVVADLLEHRAAAPGAQAFYTGLEMLGAKAPDLALIALRLVLAGKNADDAAVVRLREIVERARAKGADAQAAAVEYHNEVRT